MRIGTRSLYEGIQQRLSRFSVDLNNLSEKISTGKNINRPSDDPIGLVDSLQLKTTLAQLDQYSRNVESGTAWLNLSETALNQTLDLIGRSKEITVQMVSDNQGAENRARAATEVGNLLDQAVSFGNSRLGGRYIFAGYKTKTVPFSKVTLGGIETAQYNGDTNNFQIQIGKSENLTIGRNGETVFMDSGLFDTLGNLKKALEDNNTAGISQQLDNLKTAEDSINNQIADIGARANRLDAKHQAIQELTFDLQERISQVEDIDLAEVTIKLKAKELAYQAALMTAAKINQMTLLNYLG